METEARVDGQWAVFERHRQWLLEQVTAAVVPRLAVVGPVDSGKSTFFRLLAERQPHRAQGWAYHYWDLTEFGAARTSEGFWKELSGVLGLSDTPAPDRPVAELPHLLAQALPGTRPVLVLDHWDQAREFDRQYVDLRALNTLAHYVSDLQMRQREAAVRLGLILVTRFPSVDLLVHFARRSRLPGLHSLSGPLDRFYRAALFPMLDEPGARMLLAQLGCPPDLVPEVVEACGGWLGLLRYAARRIQESGGRLDDEAERLIRDDLELMLEKSLLPEVAAKRDLTSNAEAWRWIMRDIMTSNPNPQSRYGLPVAFGSAEGSPDAPWRLPELLRTHLLASPYLVVDLENLRMRFERHAQREPTAYAHGIDDFTRSRFPGVLREVAAAYGIPQDRVVLAAKSRERALQVLGPLPPGWVTISADLHSRKGHKSEHDDAVGIGFMAYQTGQDPRARFVLITEDQGHPATLGQLGVRDVILWTPFEAPRELLKRVPPSWTVRENLLPEHGVLRPPVGGTG